MAPSRPAALVRRNLELQGSERLAQACRRVPSRLTAPGSPLMAKASLGLISAPIELRPWKDPPAQLTRPPTREPLTGAVLITLITTRRSPAGNRLRRLSRLLFRHLRTRASNQEGALKAGTVGFGWHEVEIIKVGNDVTWTIDGLTIATLTGATLAGNNIFVGHWDVFASTTANPAMNFSVVDNWQVEVIPEPSTWLLGFLGATGLLSLRLRKK